LAANYRVEKVMARSWLTLLPQLKKKTDGQPGRQLILGPLAVGLFVAVWSVGVLAFDGIVAWCGYKQLAALSWPTAGGIVIKSEIKIERGKENNRYFPVVEYGYSVNGVQHRGDGTLRYGEVFYVPDQKRAERVVRRFPRGAPVTVWYNRERPAESMLQPGLSHHNAWTALFLVPLNIAMLAMWLSVWEDNSLARGGLPRRVKIRRHRDGFALQIYQATPLGHAAQGLLLGSLLPCIGGVSINCSSAKEGVASLALLLMLILMCVFGWLMPWDPIIYVVWAVAAALAAGFWYQQHKRKVVFRVNRAQGTFEMERLPSGRRVVGRIADICRVRVIRDRRRPKTLEGDWYGVTVKYAWGSGGRWLVLVNGWQSRARAAALARWLRRELGMGGMPARPQRLAPSALDFA
jgi:hypothetical protein